MAYGGILKLGVDDPMPAATVVTIGSYNSTTGASTSGTLDLNGHKQTIGGLLDYGTGNRRVVNSGGGTPTLTINNSGDYVYNGLLGHTGQNSFALTKQGTRKLPLGGNNTYTGDTTISGGTLALATGGTNNIPSSPLITVGSGAFLDVTGVGVAGGFALAPTQTLKGLGTVLGDMTIGGTATVSPGMSPGTLPQTGNQTWAGAGIYTWEINATEDAGGSRGNDPGWDWLNIDGALAITATPSDTFVIDVQLLGPGGSPGMPAGFDALKNYSWEIATASLGVSGFDASKFSLNLPLPLEDNWHGGRWFLTQDGNGVFVNYAIPEPSTFVLAALALLGLLGWRWKRGS